MKTANLQNDYSTLVDHSFRLGWPSVPMFLTNQPFRWTWPPKNPACSSTARIFVYLLLIDLSPRIFIACDFDTILSIIASAKVPLPSLLCHPATSNWEQNAVEWIRYFFSSVSRISSCSALLVPTNSPSSSIKRSHFIYRIECKLIQQITAKYILIF